MERKKYKVTIEFEANPESKYFKDLVKDMNSGQALKDISEGEDLIATKVTLDEVE
jgi:hypothetical protein